MGVRESVGLVVSTVLSCGPQVTGEEEEWVGKVQLLLGFFALLQPSSDGAVSAGPAGVEGTPVVPSAAGVHQGSPGTSVQERQNPCGAVSVLAILSYLCSHVQLTLGLSS